MAKGLETVGVWVAIGVMAAVAWIDFRTTDDLVETSRWVVHTQQVIQSFDDVLLATTAAGRARRSYWMTGDEAEAERTLAAIDHATASLEQARVSTLDNASQQARWQRLKPLVETRLGEVRAALDKQRSSSGRDNDYEEALLRRGNAQMTSVAAAIDDADSAERALLAERQKSASRSADFAKSTALAGTAIAIAIIAFAFARLRSENDRRLASEQALRASERFLDSIVENIPAMIFVKDASELRFQRLNRTGEALLGVARGDLLGKNDFDLFPRDQADFFQKKDRLTLEEGATVDIMEEPIATKNGARWLHTKKVPIRGDDGRPRFLLGISEDVTEQKRTAEALRGAIAAAQNANRELEAFSYSVAHDLRAPLRAIDGFSQAILEDCADRLDEAGRTHLARVRASAARMAELIDGLLGLSRLARAEVRFEAVDLSALAAQVVEDLRHQSPDRDVAVEIAPALAARGDPRILRVVVDNLLRNAFKFTAKRPRATIAFGAMPRTAGNPVFFVKDDGVGFDPRYKDKLFGAFQRLHDAREFPGTGIGLATVERAVKRHGGRIWAESELGRGATFFFTLSEGGTQEHAAE
ncbi:MAG TPA: ATP-binding protein [Polyangiaceae bacterium]|nr:ATP-binding protein [Polyangiaceae bacterium]